jgi:hypothetical protein
MDTVEWVGDARDMPLPHAREAALCRVGATARTEVRVELCRFESRQPSFMHDIVTADAGFAVELVLVRWRTRESTTLPRKEWL